MLRTISDQKLGDACVRARKKARAGEKETWIQGNLNGTTRNVNVRQLQFPTRAPHLSDFLASNCCSNCRMNGTIKSRSSR